MTRTVFAIDVTTTMVSLARVQETEDGTAARPDISWVEPISLAHFSPYSCWHHAKATANQVIEKLTKGGNPTLVVFATQFWAAPKTDPSAARRFRIVNAIEDALFEKQIPVVEMPAQTAARWLLGYTPRGRGGVITEIGKEVTAEWGIACPSYTPEGSDVSRNRPYRLTTVALAAAGAQAVGIRTSVEATAARLDILRDTGNNSMRWPADLKLPRSVKKWEELNAEPNLLRPAS